MYKIVWHKLVAPPELTKLFFPPRALELALPCDKEWINNFTQRWIIKGNGSVCPIDNYFLDKPKSFNHMYLHFDLVTLLELGVRGCFSFICPTAMGDQQRKAILQDGEGGCFVRYCPW